MLAGYEDVAVKYTSRRLKVFSPENQDTQLIERREVRLELKRGDCVRNQRQSKIYRLGVAFPKSTQNLVISRRSCVRTAKKFTKKT